MNHNQLTALRQLCDRVVADQYSRIDVDDALIVAKGCLSALNEIALLEEQRGGNTTPIFWELLAERDKLKEEVEQLGREAHSREATLDVSLARIHKLEARLQATREAFKDIINRAQHIREDKAVVGIEASFIERTAKAIYEDKD